MGRPGSGKGVQSELLNKHLGYKIFSTGSRVREISKADTPLGHKVAEVSNAGLLTPFWFASYLFEEAIFLLKTDEGIIFEGVGRKEEEAKLFTEINDWLGRDFRIIYLDVSENTAVERLKKRREIEHREDDKGDKLETRMESYTKYTIPALDYFKSMGKVIEVDGEPSEEIISENIMQKISTL